MMTRTKAVAQRLNLNFNLGIPGLIPQWKKLLSPQGLKEDFVAGLTVACVSVPLSLALALASGMTPATGLITAMVAGVVCSLFGGTPLLVSGPANTMVVLTALAIKTHGLSSILFIAMGCGFLQILSGIIGLGHLARFIPLPVVSGFTSGVGAILFIGQLPSILGIAHPKGSHPSAVFSQVFENLLEADPQVMGLALGTFLITWFLDQKFKKLPSALIAVTLMTLTSLILGLQVTTIGSIPQALPLPHLPSWPERINFYLFGSIGAFYLFSSFETLLSSAALDKLKNQTRHDPNQELIGQGLGNIISALFGGMPVAGAIARSALNVQAGAQTRRASLFHSAVIFLFVMVASSILAQIPKPVLSGILLFVAVRMLNIQEMTRLWSISKIEAVSYWITFSVIVFFDLIAGIQAGILSAMIILALRLSPLQSQVHPSESEEPYRIALQGYMNFLSLSKMNAVQEKLKQLNHNPDVVIDLSEIQLIDASGAEAFIELVQFIQKRGSQVALLGLSPRLKKVLNSSDRQKILPPLYALVESDVTRVLNRENHSSAIQRLKFGVQQFQKDSNEEYRIIFDRLAEAQDPHTLFITCCDSRINPNLITSSFLGELFILRNVGNIIPPYQTDDTPAEAAAVEFALGILNVKEIVICAHSGCGAMEAILKRDQLNPLPSLQKWLGTAGELLQAIESQGLSADEASRMNAVIQMENLICYPLIQEKMKTHQLQVHAWYYDIRTGQIEEWDPKCKQYVRMLESDPGSPLTPVNPSREKTLSMFSPTKTQKQTTP
ncbi:MAG: bifunctional SulP family inorganic anion transporter/carbonic anhydrase [Bdellovibrionia bacterium]